MMDEFGEDVPSRPLSESGFVPLPLERKPNLLFPERKYLPSAADLIDRLAIVILKQINLPENRAAYDQERADIEHDLSHCIVEYLDGKSMSAILILMLANKTIWDNEKDLRAGGENSMAQLRFSHSINGIRSRAKNVLAEKAGERIDRKVDCLASDLPPEFGNWDII